MSYNRRMVPLFQKQQSYVLSCEAMIQFLDEVFAKLPKEKEDKIIEKLKVSVLTIPQLIAEAFCRKNLREIFESNINEAKSQCENAILLFHFLQENLSPYVNSLLVEDLISKYFQINQELDKNLGEVVYGQNQY